MAKKKFDYEVEKPGAGADVVSDLAEPSGEVAEPVPSLAPGEFIAEDGRRFRKRHEPQGSGWRDWSEPVND